MTRGPSTGDPATMKTRLLTRPCATCIVAHADRNPMGLSPGRLRQIIGEARRGESFIICHGTLPSMAPPGYPGPAVCRGFADKFSTQALQVIERLFGFTEVDPPEMTEGNKP